MICKLEPEIFRKGNPLLFFVSLSLSCFLSSPLFYLCYNTFISTRQEGVLIIFVNFLCPADPGYPSAWQTDVPAGNPAASFAMEEKLSELIPRFKFPVFYFLHEFLFDSFGRRQSGSAGTVSIQIFRAGIRASSRIGRSQILQPE